MFKFILLLFFIPLISKSQNVNFEKLYEIYNSKPSIQKLDSLFYSKGFDKTNGKSCDEIVYTNHSNPLEKIFIQNGAVFYEVNDSNNYFQWLQEYPKIPNIKLFSKSVQDVKTFNKDFFISESTYSVNDFFLQMGVFYGEKDAKIYSIHFYDKESCYNKKTIGVGYPKSKI